MDKDDGNSRDDDNTWDCTVCTFKNPAEAFKCLMCDVRKGTSTRKPRINPELVAQQVARQQQRLLLKISHNRTKDGNKEDNGKESRNDSDGNSRDSEDRRDSKVKDHENELGSETKRNSKQSKHRKSLKDGSPGPSCRKNSNRNSFGPTGRLKKSRKDKGDGNPSTVALLANTNSDSSNSSSSNSSLLSSSTTTSPSKNGLSSKLKNVDRNNCSSEAVTVNNVTVIISEFKWVQWSSA